MSRLADIRGVARMALIEYPHFSGHTVLRRWGQDIDERTLPAFGVFTPRKARRRVAVDHYMREADLAVLIRRKGGDSLEDDLDDDAEFAEPLILREIARIDGVEDIEMATADTDIPGLGAERIGSVLMTFKVLWLI